MAQAGGNNIAVVRASECVGRLGVVRPGGKATEVLLNKGVGLKGLSETGQAI